MPAPPIDHSLPRGHPVQARSHDADQPGHRHELGRHLRTDLRLHHLAHQPRCAHVLALEAAPHGHALCSRCGCALRLHGYRHQRPHQQGQVQPCYAHGSARRCSAGGALRNPRCEVLCLGRCHGGEGQLPPSAGGRRSRSVLQAPWPAHGPFHHLPEGFGPCRPLGLLGHLRSPDSRQHLRIDGGAFQPAEHVRALRSIPRPLHQYRAKHPAHRGLSEDAGGARDPSRQDPRLGGLLAPPAAGFAGGLSIAGARHLRLEARRRTRAA
mmetsp:Transcript_121175/g.258671  ORF Transcript_121175/g.258671 Transcript_121175/m.258671 type:complete len:267 (+) Transcript_121175:249-1049(+)